MHRLTTMHAEIEVQIPCPIQPGAVAERYSVEWRLLSPQVIVLP